MTVSQGPTKRMLKSYVCRSRMSIQQRKTLNDYWPIYGIEVVEEKIDTEQLFQRNAPVVLEIGFGMGDVLINLATTHAGINFIGIDVHRPGVGALLSKIEQRGIRNIKIFNADALKVLEHCIPDDSLMAILIFFPDPWPKRRHQKRRIIQMPFVDLIHQKLKKNGYFHLATDIREYATHMFTVVNSHNGFHNIKDSKTLSPWLQRPKTKFEQRGENLGHCITDLVFAKI